MVAKGEGDGREMDWEFGISRSKLLYTGWINKVLGITQETIMKKNMNKNIYTFLCVHVTEPLCCTSEISTFYINYTSIKIKF